MMIESLRGAKDHLSEFAERAHGTHDWIFIARNGHVCGGAPSAPTTLESTEETMAILSDLDALRAIAEAKREVAEGDMLRGCGCCPSASPQVSAAPYRVADCAASCAASTTSSAK